MRRKKKFSEITDEDFALAVKNNYSIRDVLGCLGYSRSSGSMGVRIRKRIEELNLDISHFYTDAKSIERASRAKYSIEEILIQNSSYENISSLKKRLIKEGLLEYKCEICGDTGSWNGMPLTLQLEHKNGIHNDHRIENLCFLCPNCHSQTDTYSGRNIGRYEHTYDNDITCGSVVTS